MAVSGPNTAKPAEALLRPFKALRAAPEAAASVASPPYDVLTTEEARSLVAGGARRFLHVSRPEIEFPEGTDPTLPEVYAKAGDNLKRLVAEGALVREQAPSYYVYRLRMGDHAQTGLVAAASVSAYEAGGILRHELTRPNKEDDRVRHMEALDAQTGPVLLVHRPAPRVRALLQNLTRRSPTLSLSDENDVGHTVWVVSDKADVAALTEAADAEITRLYIADGHHRSAAAARVAAARPGSPLAGRFLSVSFPADELRILDYNRLIRDLNGLTDEQFVARLKAAFEVSESARPVRPEVRGSFGMYWRGQWYTLVLREVEGKAPTVAAALDIALLSTHLIEPILGIADPRRDSRIDFVGGRRGLEGLSGPVDAGKAVLAFALRPPDMTDLLAVADAGEIMPPKSTWFEPKLADGLISYPLH